MCNEHTTKITTLDENLVKFKNHYVKSFASFKSQLSSLGAAIVSQDLNNNSLDQENPSSSTSEEDAVRIATLENFVYECKDDLSDLKQSLRSDGNETEFEKLNDRVREIESRVSGESCNINNGDFIFTSETEVGLWLDRENVESLGIFWDMFSVLVAMAPKRLTGKERADLQFSSDRIQSTTAENELAASMAYERPQTLYGDKDGKLVPLEEGFGSCKTHDKWVLGSQSFKTMTTKQLKTFKKGIMGNLTPNCGGKSLSRVLLNDVSSQWNDTVAFIDSFFQYLTETAHFPKSKSWKLVGQCCAAIFDAMEPYRAVVSQIEDLSLLTSKAKFLWCVLQCHRVMKEFIAKDFRGHPQMVKQISLFMINERVDPVAFEKLEDKVTAQAVTIDGLEKQVALLKRTVGNYENLRKDIVDLQKTMKNKKDK